MLEKLRKGLENFRECTFPGLSDFPIVIVPLSLEELQQSHAKAEERFRLLGIELTVLTADDFSSELHVQVLARALRDPQKRDDYLFASADDLRQNITADEKILLVDEYVEVQAAANPVPDQITDELFEQIEEEVKKKDLHRLSSIGSRGLASYLLSLESRRSS